MSFIVSAPTSPAHAIALQQELRTRVVIGEYEMAIRTIAGIDVSHDLEDNSHAAIVVLDAQSLKPLESLRISAPTEFPYIPGLLSFHEIPIILSALEKLSRVPDVLMVDGQGIAHPRRLGIAAHLGVLMDLPAIGVAKSRLTGHYKALGETKGSQTALMDGREQLGTVLRSRENCLPLFISPGHKCSHAQALDITLRCVTRYRLPEPTRLADKLSKTKSMSFL